MNGKGAGAMSSPVSSALGGEALVGALAGWVVGRVVLPAAPDWFALRAPPLPGSTGKRSPVPTQRKEGPR
jgi:hypothetical protein